MSVLGYEDVKREKYSLNKLLELEGGGGKSSRSGKLSLS